MHLSSVAEQKSIILAEIVNLKKLMRQTQPPISQDDTIPPWQILGGDQKWHSWLNVRIVEKNSELAILSANFEEQKIRTQRAVGHHDAFIKLTKNI